MISIKRLFKVLIINVFLLIFIYTVVTNVSLNSNNNSNGLFGYKIYVKDNRLFVLNNKKIFDLDVGDQVVYKNFDNKLLITRLYSKDNDCYKTKDDSIDMINKNVVCNNNLLGNVVLNITSRTIPDVVDSSILYPTDYQQYVVNFNGIDYVPVAAAVMDSSSILRLTQMGTGASDADPGAERSEHSRSR